MKIIDCTSFYNEHLMYEIRLNILNDKVDKFIVTESTYSHSGQKKTLNFDINNYPKFKDKIIYIVIDKEPIGIVPENNDPSLQRSNSLKRIALSYDESLKVLKNFFVLYLVDYLYQNLFDHPLPWHLDHRQSFLILFLNQLLRLLF